MTAKEHAIEIFKAGVEAVQAVRLMPQVLRVEGQNVTICGQSFSKDQLGDIYIIGAGKASAAMAVEAERILGGCIKEGIVTTKYGHLLPTQKIRIVEAAHPIPDEACVEAVEQTLTLLQQVTEWDIVICLISGGASALWCDLPKGITLQDMRSVSDLLVRSEADISEINSVRKHLSRIKGGQLVRYCNDAQVFSLVISDVPGDSLEVIASGPTVPDSSTYQQAYGVLKKYDLLEFLPSAVRIHMENGISSMMPETPKQGDPLFLRTVNRVIGSNAMALQAAERKARELGYEVQAKEQVITGETTEQAGALVNWARQYDGKRPACLLQGGETTLKVTGNGKGGRNQHFVLSALQELNKEEGIVILSGGTDGTDGPTDATGAVADSDTREKANRKGLSSSSYLQNHDAYHFFQHTGDLLITGPTQTNVMDIMMAILT